jgi:cation:H+ antiporter
VGGAWVNGECVGGQFYDYRSYTAANMTGGNRLLIGIGWALVALLFWFRQKRALALERGILLELVFLGAATVYSFLIFFRKEIALWDAGVLIGLFGAYIWLSSRAETREPELIGPSAALGSLRKGPRRLATVLLFLYSALAILASAEPFADGLVELGKSLEIDEFILVQWVAPLASESPEILIAAIFTLQGNATAAMMALVSAKVNQWTLLVGCIPVVYSISLGDASALHLDPRQTEEFLLTAAQSLFAVILLLRLRIGWLGALTLFLLFASQLFIPSIHARYIYSFVYLGLAMLLLAMDGQRRAMVWYMVRGAVWHGDR